MSKFQISVLVLLTLIACAIFSTVGVVALSLLPQRERSATSVENPAPKKTTRPTPKASDSGYVPIMGKFWTGVKVYTGSGSDKTLRFEILGGSENCPTIPSGRGVKVRFPSGSEEWKDRDYLISSGLFFVRKNDPAISAMEWYEYYGCP